MITERTSLGIVLVALLGAGIACSEESGNDDADSLESQPTGPAAGGTDPSETPPGPSGTQPDGPAQTSAPPSTGPTPQASASSTATSSSTGSNGAPDDGAGGTGVEPTDDPSADDANADDPGPDEPGTDDGAGGTGGAPAQGAGGETPSEPSTPSAAGGDGSGGQTTGAAGSGETPAPVNPGTCTLSQTYGMRRSGSGPHEVVVETNTDPGINEGTIFRPAELGTGETYPILVWGEGACERNGLSNATAMAEIASHGYFVVADGAPDGDGNREMNRNDLEGMAAPLIAYLDWALAENDKPCSAYYQSLDAAAISANGFSCGGLMAQGMVLDPRVVTWGVTSSGMAGAGQDFYELIDTPVLFVEGGPSDSAYNGANEGYDAIAALGVPVLWFSKDIGHGGDLFTPDGGDFTRINLAWLNWWLKGDEGATGKGLLVGADCPFCSDATWDVKSANLP